MKFKLEIQCDNAAFWTPTFNEEEIARILRKAASKIETFEHAVFDGIVLLDSNGNAVGSATMEDQDDASS